MTWERTMILDDANHAIVYARNNQYGEPTQDFTRTAKLWNAYLEGRTQLEAHDVAVLMCLLKISRISWSPDHRDNWVDLAGYAACGYETRTTNKKEQQ